MRKKTNEFYCFNPIQQVLSHLLKCSLISVILLLEYLQWTYFTIPFSFAFDTD